jgi:hypothetical protein
MRTWGFNDRNRTTIAGGLPQYGGEGAGPSPNVMQWWNNGKAEINLTPFDKVVTAAQKTNMKLIVTLTNNWADYGGMDVYTVQLGGQYHDDVSEDHYQDMIDVNYKLIDFSSTASQKSKPLTRTTSPKSSNATPIPPAYSPGNLPTSHAAAPTASAIFPAAPPAPPTPSPPGSTN